MDTGWRGALSPSTNVDSRNVCMRRKQGKKIEFPRGSRSSIDDTYGSHQTHFIHSWDDLSSFGLVSINTRSSACRSKDLQGLFRLPSGVSHTGQHGPARGERKGGA
jgi:hypothetical protein